MRKGVYDVEIIYVVRGDRINNGEIEWAKGYGVVESGGNRPITSRTMFQAASISESVAAVAALVLVEEGKLSLDEDVNPRLKSWKVPESDLTKENTTA
ncbi:MAG: serine hydrolase [Blastocatellia bacterium]